MTIYMLRLEFGPKSYSFLSCWTPEPVLQGSRYSNLCYSTNPLFLNLSHRPSLRRHSLSPWKQRREEGEEEKRREGKLGHVFVDPPGSSPKTGWDSSPLFIFPFSMTFPHCSWWCRLVWYSAARLDAKKKGKQSGIAVVIVVFAFALVVCKGKP